MSHLVDTMAYAGETPWHGLGAALEGNETIDQWRVAAGMDWRIKSTAVRFPTSTGPKKFEGRNVLFRSDTEEALSVVSDSYKVVQPSEVLEFFRDVTEAGHMKMETAGVLDMGKKLWALCRIDQDIKVGNDVMQNYVLLATACDGSMATRAYYTNVRVVCNNTLQFSLQDQHGAISVPHSTTFDATRVQSALGFDRIGSSIEHFAGNVETLANIDMSGMDAREFFSALVTKTDFNADRDDLTGHQTRTIENLEALAISSPGAQLETARGTAWGLVNAATHWIDFHTRSASNNNRFKSAQFGDGAHFKKRAVDLGLALAAA